MAVFNTTLKVGGLTADRYLTQNPVWIDLLNDSSSTRYITVEITPVNWDDDAGPQPQAMNLRLRPHQGSLYFDLARYIRGMMPSPKHPVTLTNGMAIPRNLLKAKIKFNAIANDGEVLDTREVTKTFIRGGQYNRESNITIADESILVPTPKIPYWPGYPIAVYQLSPKDGGFIQYQAIGINPELLEERRKIGCEPVYVRFLNRSGGYSFWLFETYKLNKKTSKTEVIERRDHLRTTGNRADYTLSVRGRVERDYFGLLRNLAESPEVAIWNLEPTLADFADGTFNNKGSWTNVVNNGQSIDTPGQALYLDLEFKFDVILTHNPQVKW